MNQKDKILLLHIIKSRGNIKQLLREGFTYKSISELLETLVEEDLIEYESQKINLTTKGIDYLECGKEKIKKTDKNKWIEKEKASKVHKLDKNFIFLPNQDELHF